MIVTMENSIHKTPIHAILGRNAVLSQSLPLVHGPMQKLPTASHQTHESWAFDFHVHYANPTVPTTAARTAAGKYKPGFKPSANEDSVPAA